MSEKTDVHQVALAASKRDTNSSTVAYDATTDILTIDGYKFSGELLRQFTVTPCGTMFRIVERKGGVITVSSEQNPLAVAAPAMLAMLREALLWIGDKSFTPHALNDECTALVEKLEATIAAAVGDRPDAAANSDPT